MTKIKNILITGCSHDGIGYDTACLLREQGVEVYATCRAEQDCQKLRDEGFISFVLDYSDEASIEKGFKQALEHGNGRIDALFNNGAYGMPARVEDIPTQALRDMFDVNFFGWHHLTRLVLPVMRAQNFGYIIQNSSILGLVALRDRGAYVASKFAVEGLSDALRLELHGTNIHISIVEPGPIESKFRINSYKMFDKYIKREDCYDKDHYDRLARNDTSAPLPFGLPARAVSDKILTIVSSNKPNPRYYVTLPTYFFCYLKRILSTRLLDHYLRKV